MKNKELQDKLSKLDPELEVYAIDRSSGCSYQISYPRQYAKKSTDNFGSLCELDDGKQVILVSLDD